MRSGWLSCDELSHVLAALTPANRLACEVAMATGLRIGDVLSLTPQQLSHGRRITVKEQKTGKARKVYIPAQLHERMIAQSGRHWVFEGRSDARKHRTRQAVWYDVRRAAAALRCKEHISPHSTRKAWAVDRFHSCGDLRQVQQEMRHSSPEITMLYAMADVLQERRGGKCHRGSGKK